MSIDRPLDVLILGCGSRGRMFGDVLARRKDLGRVVAVAEPDAARRDRVANTGDVSAEKRFHTWEEALAQPRMADVAVVTLMDRQHFQAAIRAMELGYHLLLEKPMATTLEECITIDRVRQQTGRTVAVCHSMRHIKSYAKVKNVIDSGVMGRLISIDQLEGVAPTHQAHSFVRGNWGNESRSAFMLLAKSCHDLDYISWLMGENAVRVSSFGTLTYFTRQHRPEGAPARCVEGCPVGDTCPYNAEKHYRDGKGYASWIGLNEWTPEQREKFLWESPYGHCAYDMDNDVVDHQVVAMEFPSQATGTFTMTAFAPAGRRIRVHGTKAYMEAIPDQHTINLWHFGAKEDRHEQIKTEQQEGTHGGGDENLLEAFIEAVRHGDPTRVLTGTDESLRSHAVVFAAEMARRSKRVVELKDGLPVM